MRHLSAVTYCEACKVNLWLSKLPLDDVQGDVLLCTSLQELPDMNCVLRNLTVIYDDIIHDAAVASKACEGLIHSTVVVFWYGGYTIRSSEVLEPPKRCNEGGEELTFII